MEVYRVAKDSRIRDLSGTGAFLYGGRWNPRGIFVVYASESPALAALEALVHMDLTVFPSDMSMATINVSDKAGMTAVSEDDLPKGWRHFPAPQELAEIGKAWVAKGDTLLLRVPSVIVMHAHNILINPHHEDIDKVRVVRVEPYKFDHRLFSH
jgi:RES domain-containing protein